jgi:hypothetical protein
MDSLSVGISILCFGAKGQATGVADCQWRTSPHRFRDHERLEMAITIVWKR